jgi:hypothetical protein
VIDAIRAEPGQVVRCWFPEPRGPLFQLDNGANAEVLIGAPAYQLTSGDIVAL